MSSFTTFIIGSINGDLARLSAVLEAIGVAEYNGPNLQWRPGCKDVIVQTGDLLGRDDKSYECYAIMKRLQLQSRDAANGGNVILLVGDHELQYVSNIKSESFSDRLSKALGPKLKSDVISGNYTAAHALSKTTLITHAGALRKMCGLINDALPYQLMFNDALVRAVKTGKLGPMFSVGNDLYQENATGIFHTEYRRLVQDSDDVGIMQIVGHEATPVIERRRRTINVNCNKKLGVLTYIEGRGKPKYFDYKEVKKR